MSQEQPNESASLAGRLLDNTYIPFALPAIGWVLAWNLQLAITDIVQLPDFFSAVYLTSGVQICAALMFGIRGLVGSYLGSLYAFLMYPDDRYPAPIIDLGLWTLSLSVIAYVSVECVRRFNKLNENFDKATLRDLVFIVLLYNVGSSIAHYAWTTYFSLRLDFPIEHFVLGFFSRVVGSFVVVYAFLAIFELLHLRKISR